MSRETAIEVSKDGPYRLTGRVEFQGVRFAYPGTVEEARYTFAISRHAIADLASARIAPWQRDTLWLLADLVDADGTDSGLCMRGVLRRVIARLAERGLHAMVASEPELT